MNILLPVTSLPRPADDNLDWQDRAVCAQTDPEVFFPDKGCSPRDAKTVCMDCRVRVECLTDALRNDEQYGVWGALTRTERKQFQATGWPAERLPDFLDMLENQTAAVRHAS